jgi:hypothetical protein
MIYRDIGCEGWRWTELTHDKVQWRALVLLQGIRETYTILVEIPNENRLLGDQRWKII